MITKHEKNGKAYYTTSLERMFYSCKSLTDLDLSNFDTAGVTDMSHTFAYTPALKKLNISKGKMDIDYKLIGERIKDARRKKGWSQEKLSEEIDVAIAYISRVERGAQVNLKRLAQISKVLDISIEQLLGGTAPESSNYLDKDLYQVLVKCTPEKQKLIYNIAKIVSGAKFV